MRNKNLESSAIFNPLKNRILEGILPPATQLLTPILTGFTEPVKGLDFLNRDYFLNTLIKRAKALKEGYRQNIAILGPEAVGKTSLILQFIWKLQKHSEMNLIIYLEITNRIPFSYLVNKFIASIIFGFLKRKKMHPPQELALLLADAGEFIPKTIEEAKRCLGFIKNNRNDDAYSLMLDLPQILSEEMHSNIVLILEEFHNFNTLPLKNPFAILSKKIMLHKNIMYIISSSRMSFARRILSHDLTFLFGNFEVLELENFSVKTSEEFIERKLGEVKCGVYYKQFICEITNGQPFYLSTISKELYRTARENGIKFLTDKILIDTLLNLIFNSDGILNQFFIHRLNQLPLNRSPISYSSILLALGHNYFKSRQIKDYLKINSEKEFLSHLNRLLELDYVEKNGLFYHLHDKLFKLWLIHVHDDKNSSLEIDDSFKRQGFRDAMQKELLCFLQEKRKSVLERLKDLFVSFKNQIIYLDSKRVVLPVFNFIELKNTQGATPFMICRTKNNPWLFVVCKDCVHESEMGEIISDYKKLRLKFRHKIVVSLEGIAQDAKLMAKEEGFLSLELRELNKLLGLFGKNKIYID